jgi:allantoate deiminase
MRAAGLAVRVDAVGNLVGRREGGAKTLLLGSHLDTVRAAGRFDGALGVLLALAAAEACGPLPFALEVLGFIDEEGVRFHSTYLGSRALAGTLSKDILATKDADGVALREAMRTFGGDPEALAHARRNPDSLLGYFEAHIEQGPVLEAAQQPLGLVSAIAGQTRAQVTFTGQAGHAGTVPMQLRADALCAAAELVTAIERLARATPGLVATVGQLSLAPGASNVIPGEVSLSVDVRHQDDAARVAALACIRETLERIAAARGVRGAWRPVQDTPAVQCDASLTRHLAKCISGDAPRLPSGAGHDAAALAALCPVAMLFVRCRGGVSHHPDEFASEEDIAAAHAATLRFLESLAAEHA